MGSCVDVSSVELVKMAAYFSTVRKVNVTIPGKEASCAYIKGGMQG